MQKGGGNTLFSESSSSRYLKKLVIIPTYNEIENIHSILDAIFSLHKNYHVLIVDDGSPDGTGAVVKEMMAGKYLNCLFLEERKGKLGLGTAYIHGFKWALRHGYDYIFEMDADFSHNPSDLERLYHACHEGNDVAIGSRYVLNGSIENWPLDRRIYSKGGAIYTWLITFLPVKDPTAGFVCYKSKVLQRMNLDEIKFIGYAFQIEMKFAAWKLGFKIKEVPITFRDRKKGTSKMSFKILKEGILGVMQMQYQYLFGNYKKCIENISPEKITVATPVSENS